MSDLADPVTHWLKHAAKFVELAVQARGAGDRVTMIVSLQRAAECVQLAKALQPETRVREPRRHRRRRPYDEAQRRFRRQSDDGGEAA
jgi:CelD/BcsL family acetyltransferase involved in cellulose biosynthesis